MATSLHYPRITLQPNSQGPTLIACLRCCDHDAPQGLKKTQVGKTLDALAEAGRVTAKEFGKTKIYFLPQSGLAVMSKEESDAKQAEVAALKASVQQVNRPLKRANVGFFPDAML